MENNSNQDNSNQNKTEDKINLDYDWNTEYGDGDIPDIDKNSVRTNHLNKSNQNKEE